MNIDTAKRVREVLDEIEILQKYEHILSEKSVGHLSHMEFCQHFGDCKDYDKVVFHQKYTPRFIKVVEEIIKELEDELEKL